MKYIIFNNGEYFRLASTEAKKSKWLEVQPGSVAKEISDADFYQVVIGSKTPTLENDTLTLVHNIRLRSEMNAEQLALAGDATLEITDSAEAQAKLQALIDHNISTIEEICGDELDHMTEEKSFITFLKAINVSQKTSWPEGQWEMDYIYSLPNCPQVYVNDICVYLP